MRDTVKAPFAVAERPPDAVVGRVWRWTGDEIFQTGAVTLGELIERIAGSLGLRSGFLLAPHVVAWHADPGRVRVFLDGVQVDALNPRVGGVLDLSAIPVWQFEEVHAETAPGELRVYLRTWRVERTTPFTRIDVLTGDEETNLYRGYYGRRFASGLGLQGGFQQQSSVTPDVGGDGDGLSMFARVGVARDAWSVDVSANRVSQTRNATLRTDVPGSVPAFTGSTTLTHLRAGWRSPDAAGPWAQLVVAAHSFDESTPRRALGPNFGDVPADSADTSAFRAQYVVAGGATRLGVEASAALRYRRFAHEGFFSPSLRLRTGFHGVRVQAFAERAAEDSLARGDVALGVAPWSWLRLGAAVSRRYPVSGSGRRALTVIAADAELRWRRVTIGAGIVSRDTTDVAALPVFARGIVDTLTSAATGLTYAVHGPVFKQIEFDVRGTRWESADFYRPADVARAELSIDTDWLTRFPRGEFSFRLATTLDHRGEWLVPVDGEAVVVPSARTYGFRVEVRIKTATIGWQYRNFLGTVYQTVPGYAMPRAVNLYGVRWNFTN